MKKLLVFAVFGLFSLVTVAQNHGHGNGHGSGTGGYGGGARDSELVLRLWDDSNFTVVFDHSVYSAPTSVFRLDNVEPGVHRLIVKQSEYGRYGEVVNILYRGDIRIPDRTKVVAGINRNFNLEIVKEEYLGGSYSSGDNYGGYCDSHSGGGYYAKPPLDINDLKITLQNAGFESDRKMIAEQAVAMHSIITDDVFQIMLTFGFESSKLDFAKFAYPHCEDKQNYYRVNDAFSFSSSIRELNDYILGYGRRGGSYQYYDYKRH